jgi:rRNA maturation protein Rpf1
VILITTSRHPSPRTRSLCNDLLMMIPHSVRVNRGKMNERELLAFSSAKGARTLVIIDSHMGNSGAISLNSIRSEECEPPSLKLNILRVRLRRELTSQLRCPPTKDLFVLKGEVGSKLERLAEMLAKFLGANLIEAAVSQEMHDTFGNARVVLKIEERPTEFILRFVNATSAEEYGPQIAIRR